MAELSDDELLLMFREGDADAFDVLFDRYHARLYHFARVMLDGRPGADDVMQEAFMAVARAADSYRPRGRFRAWLMRIARNLCLNRLQAERARRRLGGGLELVEPAADEPTVPERLARDEHLARVRRLIGELPERQREAIALYAYEQMTYREIAEVLEVPINTVKTLIHRGRAELTRRLRAEEERNDAV